MNKPTCATCLHWQRLRHDQANGECHLPENTERVGNALGKRHIVYWFRAEADDGTPATIITRHEHSCIMHTPPPAPSA